MTKWLRKIIVPGMAAFVFAGLFERFLYAVGVWPRMLHFGKYGWVTFNWVWLIAVACCGGLAAYLSRRAGATAKQRLAAALFPVLTIGTLILLSGAATLVVRAAMGNVGVAPMVVVQGIGGYLTGFVVIPGVAMILGTLPFLDEDAGLQESQTEPSSMAKA